MKNIYEVFEEFTKAPSKNDKIDVLRRNKSMALITVLQGSFDPRIEFAVDKVPMYKPSDSPPGLGYSSLALELNRLYLFIKNHPRTPAGFSEKRREQILVQMLEVLEKKEAEVFMNMLLKKQKVPGLTSKIVEEAFPGILS